MTPYNIFMKHMKKQKLTPEELEFYEVHQRCRGRRIPNWNFHSQWRGRRWWARGKAWRSWWRNNGRRSNRRSSLLPTPRPTPITVGDLEPGNEPRKVSYGRCNFNLFSWKESEQWTTSTPPWRVVTFITAHSCMKWFTFNSFASNSCSLRRI